MTDLLTENARLREALEAAKRDTALALAQVDRLLTLTTTLATERDDSREYAVALEAELKARTILAKPAPDAVQEAARVQEIVAEAVNDQWVSTADSLPAKPGRNSYEHVRCLIFVNGEIEIGMWNCEHLCWDDDEGDDYRYDPEKPTHWMPLPAPPAAILARGEG